MYNAQGKKAFLSADKVINALIIYIFFFIFTNI